jgi:paraquat-inducible protein B
MAKKTNPKLIGGFVLGALALAVVGLLLFGGGQFLVTKRPAVLYFEGSLGGLAPGSPVNFRGVKIGTVTGMQIQYDVAKQEVHIPVFIEIEPDRIEITSGKRDERNIATLVRRGLRAQLVVQSLVTGQAIIQLDFHPDTPIRLVGGTSGIPELPTIPSGMDQLQASVSDVLNKIAKMPLDQIADRILDLVDTTNAVMRGANGLVTESRGEVKPMLDSAEALLKHVDALIADLQGQVSPLSQSLQATLDQAHDRLQLKPGEPMQNLNETLVDARRLVNNVDRGVAPVLAQGAQVMRSADAALGAATKALGAVQGTVSPNSALYFQLNDTLRQIALAATEIRVFAAYLQRNPNALLTGKR